MRLLILFATLTLAAGAQQAPPAPAPPPVPLGAEARDLLKAVQALGLESSSNVITVYYPKGHEEKALRLRALIEKAADFYERELGVREELHLAVLLPPEWNRLITWQPYGIPGVAGSPQVAFLPATDDNLAANDALSIRAGVSPEAIGQIERAGYSYDEASRRYVDLVGLHELGHTYARAFGIRSPSRWAGEMLATYFAYAYLRAHEPKQAEVWDGILRGYRDAVRPKHTTLADFERLYFGVGAQNYIWYQGQFQQMVRRVYDAQGLTFLRAVREAFPAGATGTLTPEETLRRFEKIFPGFEEWARRLGSAPLRQAALTNVTVIDGTGAPPAAGMTILVADGRIVDVFKSGAKPLPAGAETRDLRGRFVIPGLIESHTHLAPLGSPEDVDRELERMLRGGIVAAREMAGHVGVSRATRDRVKSGGLPAPDLHYPLLAAGPGFFAADPRPGRAGGPGPAPGMISGPADIAAAVERAVAAGASAVKIYAQLDVPAMRALAEEAHRRGLKVWAHPTIYPARPLDVVRAGVDGLTHACGMVWQDPDLDPSQYTAVSLNARPRFDPALVDADGPEMTALFEEMARRGVHFEPTLANHARPGDDRYGCTTEVTVAVARAAARAGVMLLTGTDFHAPPGAPHPSLHQEIQLLVSSGVLTPLEAIAAATFNPARAMGLDADLGSIAPGKAASLVVLEANPADDIAAIGRIVFVMKAGKIYER